MKEETRVEREPLRDLSELTEPSDIYEQLAKAIYEQLAKAIYEQSRFPGEVPPRRVGKATELAMLYGQPPSR